MRNVGSLRRAAFLGGAAATALAVDLPRSVAAAEDVPTADELRAALSLTVLPARITTRLGWPLTVAIVLKNGSSKDFWFFRSAPTLDYAITIVDAKGTLVARRPPQLMVLSNRNMGIAAHGDWTSTLRLDRLFALDTPGTFTLNVSTHFVFAMIPQRWPQRYGMTGSLSQSDAAYERRVDLTANPVPLEIVA